MSESFERLLTQRPPGGWTLDTFPADAPKRAELVDGDLVWVPQTTWHMATIGNLMSPLEQRASSRHAVAYRMAIKYRDDCAPAPDISIVLAHALDMDKSVFLPHEITLVAEVVCPGSEERDREDKPLIYAAMGIPTFWLIERGPDNAPIVHEHQLFGGAHRLIHTHIGHLKTEIPFPIDIPLEVPKP